MFPPRLVIGTGPDVRMTACSRDRDPTANRGGKDPPDARWSRNHVQSGVHMRSQCSAASYGWISWGECGELDYMLFKRPVLCGS